MAQYIFVLPATSSEVERMFSKMNPKNIITKKRNRLKSNTVEAIMLVGEWNKKKKTYIIEEELVNGFEEGLEDEEITNIDN